MMTEMDGLLTSYERGSLTRRQLLQALGLLAAAGTAAAQAPPEGLLKGRNLHHINLRVSNIAQSEAFYRKLFGFGPTRVVQGPDNHGFDVPDGGVIILARDDQAGRLDHFCVGVDNFDAGRMRAAVRGAGIGDVQGAADDNFFVIDPDGIRVQISSYDWSA